MSADKTETPPPPRTDTEAPDGMQADVPPSALDDEAAFAEQAQARAAEDNPALAKALRRAREAAAEAIKGD